MRNSLTIFISILVLCTLLHAQKVTVTAVHYMSGKDSVHGVLCVPDGKGPFPAIILIHEWWGLNDWIKENAKALSAKGYITLAVDLYRGTVTSSPDEAHELMRGLPEDRADRDLLAAATYLRKRNDVAPSRIGSVGWCMGGGYSLDVAINDPKLAACVICYGRLVTDSTTISKIACPLLGIFGQDDRGIPPADVRAFESSCRQAGRSIETKIYERSGHAFMNPNNTAGYRKDAAADAWTRIYTFFERTLKKH